MVFKIIDWNLTADTCGEIYNYFNYEVNHKKEQCHTKIEAVTDI